MIIVRSFPVAIEDLSDPTRLPTVDELRPATCPACQHPAHGRGPTLGIVGHGTYQRQVLGLVPGKSLVIRIRRYLCQACSKTISVLPDVLLPWRWYCAGGILAVLVGALLAKRSIADLRESLGPGGRSPHWTTPTRWTAALLEGLWSWIAAEVGGCIGIEPADRLRRLLGRLGVHARSRDEDLVAAARRVAGGTAHTRHAVTRFGHAP